jgi:hypothetical protein
MEADLTMYDEAISQTHSLVANLKLLQDSAMTQTVDQQCPLLNVIMHAHRNCKKGWER